MIEVGMRYSGSYQPGIYSITCKTSGRVYVGQAKNMSRRWTSHRWHLRNGSHRNRHLQNAWAKYGAEDFVFAVVEAFPDLSGEHLQQALAAAEVRAFALFPKTFNLMVVGQPSLVASEETRALWSEERLRRWANPEYRERLSAAQKGRARAPEVVEVLKAAQATPERRAAKSTLFKGLWSEPEFRAARTKERQDVWQSEEYRARQSASRSESWARTRETRSAALQAMHDDPVRGSLRRARFAATMATKPSIAKSALALMAETGRAVTAAEVRVRAQADIGREVGEDSVPVILSKLAREGRAVRTPDGWRLPTRASETRAT
jgi:hypothetical protein